MNPAALAQLAIILAPIASNIIAEGEKIIFNYRADLKQEDLNSAIQLSKGATWPELDFKREVSQP